VYEAFYGLKEKPFALQPDPAYLFMSPRHVMAYTMLEYAVQSEAGFAVITGEVGAGKTTLIRHLLNNLPTATTVGMVTNTHWENTHFLQWVMLAFGEPYDGLTPVKLFDAFQQFLIREYSAGRRCILIVDEAQNLSADALEALRLLSNINADKHLLLQIILTGQPELKGTLKRPDLVQFTQRVSVDFHLGVLDESVVNAYVHHRIKVAGRSQRLFTNNATMAVAEHTQGVPRSINVLCDMALVYGFSRQLPLIDDDIIDEVVGDRSSHGAIGRVESSGDEQSGTIRSLLLKR
jgi:type II secretory pathway predicted ATPase ExeA